MVARTLRAMLLYEFGDSREGYGDLAAHPGAEDTPLLELV